VLEHIEFAPYPVDTVCPEFIRLSCLACTNLPHHLDKGAGIPVGVKSISIPRSNLVAMARPEMLHNVTETEKMHGLGGGRVQSGVQHHIKHKRAQGEGSRR